MEKIVIIGAGGHARSVMDAIEAGDTYEVVGFVGPDVSQGGYRGREVLCDDDEVVKLADKVVRLAAFGIGYMGDDDVRPALMHSMEALGFSFPPIVDPSAVIASDASIAPGVFVGKLAVVNASASIGELAIVNSCAVIEHDCIVGKAAHISVGSILCGGVTVRDSAFVGAGATIIQNLEIGEHAVVGAGSTVLKNVPENGKALGLYA